MRDTLGPTAAGAVLTVAFGLTFASAVALVQVGPVAGVAIGAIPAALLGIGAFFAAGRTIVLCAALALPLFGVAALSQPIPIGSSNLFPQDLLLGLGFGAWLVAALVARSRGESLPVPRTPVVGWPLVLFGAAILTAAMRGHYSYGATVFGQPMRLVFYALIIVTFAGMTVQSVYRLVRWVFYTGTCVTTVLALFYIATGTSQTDQVALSTGGNRILGISVTLYAAATVFLALLSLRIATTNNERFLHLFMAGIGLFCVIVGFGRAVYLAVALVCLLFFALSRPIRIAVLSIIPLLLPLIVLFAMFLPKMAPDLVDSIGNRVSAAPATDENVQWRVKASRAVFEQIRQEPVFGVGFGQVSSFFIDVQSSAGWRVPVYQESGQDPHNGFLYLWAGGGLAALGGFLLLIVVFVVDSVRRFRGNHDPTARLLLLWSGATLGAFLLNTLSGTTFGNPPDLLCIWALLVLPSIVPYSTPEEVRLEEDVRGGGEPDPAPPAGPRRPTPATA